MSNTLNQDLTGRWVLIHAKFLKPEYSAVHDRLFFVTGGFGALPHTSGSMIGGIYMLGGDPEGHDVSRGHWVERLATDDEVAIGYAKRLAVGGKPLADEQ